MNLKRIKTILFVIFAVIFCNIEIFSQTPPSWADSKLTTYQRNNEAGYSSTASGFLDGNELVTEYDGNFNLTYSMPFGLDDFGGNITVCLNNNVSHVSFANTSAPGGLSPKYNFNSPEWIFGFMGFAVQTLNFEVNSVIGQGNTDGYPILYGYNSVLFGKQIPMLIPGYHFSSDKSRNQIVLQTTYTDKIEILRADGSILTLYNKEAGKYDGIYYEHGRTNTGYAIVKYKNGNDPDSIDTRDIIYKPGNGLTFYFREYNISYNTQENLKIVYLENITDGIDNIEFEYIRYFFTNDGYHIIDSRLGRSLISKIKLKKNVLTNNNNNLAYEEKLEFIFNAYGIPDGFNFSYIELKNEIKDQRFLLLVKNNGKSPLYSPKRELSNSESAINNYSISRIIDREGYGCNIDYNFRTRVFRDDSLTLKQPLYFPVKISYDNGKYTRLEYSLPSINQYQISHAVTMGVSLDAIDIIKNTFRDNYTNLMLKKREQSFTYEQSTESISEEYSYLWKNGNNLISDDILNKEDVYDIKTIITKKYKTQESKNIKYFNIKRAFEYPLFKAVNYLGSDNYIAKTLLVRDELYENNTLQRFITTKYDTTSPTSFLGTPTFSKLLETESIRTINDDFVVKNEVRTYNTYNVIHNVTPSCGYNKLLLKSQRTISKDSTAAMKYFCSDYSVIPDIINSENFFFQTDLLDSENVSNGSLLKYSKINRYYNSSNPSYPQLYGKIKEEIINPGSRQIKNDYEYFVGDVQNKWLLKKIITQNGSTQEFFYPTYGLGSNSSVVPDFPTPLGNKVLVSGQPVQYPLSAFPFFKPYKRTIKFNNDSLFYYTRYDSSSRMTAKIDENGYLQQYIYDSKNRIKTIFMPGGFPLPNKTIYTYPVSVPEITTIGTSNNYSIDCATNVFRDTLRIIGKIAPCDGLPQNPSTSADSIENQITGEIIPSSYWPLPSEIPWWTNTFIYLNSSISNSNYEKVTNARISLPIYYASLDGNLDTTTIIIEPVISPYFGTHFSGTVLNYQLKVYIHAGTNEINLTDLVNFVIKSNATLYGFKLRSTPVTSGTYKAIRFLKNVSPLVDLTGIKRVYRDIPIATQNYIYDNYNNNVYQNTLQKFIGDSVVNLRNRASSDPFGMLRQAMINDSVKVKSKYNYLYGKVIESDNLNGIVEKTEYDYLGRPVKITHADLTFSTIEYVIEPGNILAGNGITTVSFFEYVQTTDEVGNKFYSYFDNFGRKVAEKRGDSCTVFIFDGLSRLTNVITARGLTTTYEYDDLGFLKSKTTPDEGKINYKTDKYGNIRFVYYSKETSAGPYTVYFSNYDQLHRLKTKGSFQISNTSVWSSLNPDVISSEEGIQDNWLVVNYYDKKDLATYPFNGVPVYTRDNLKGRLSQTAFRDKPGTFTQSPWGIKLYSYDHSGRVSFYWVKQPNGTFMKIESYYDLAGNLSCQILPEEVQRFYYTYDSQGRLDSVKNGKAGEFKVSAIYSYTPDDKVKEIKYFNDFQSRSYSILNTYNNKRGWITSINGTNVGSPSNTFIENMQYYNNGLLGIQDILNSPISIAFLSNSYIYDNKNQLAQFICHTLPTKNQTFSYDADGNITWVNSLRYDYMNSNGKTNKLTSVTNPGGPQQYFYSYDYKGNLSYKSDFTKSPVVNYMVTENNYQNLPLKLNYSSQTSEYKYDDMTNRIFKTKYTTANPSDKKNEYYLRDHTGREMAIYESALNSSVIKLKMINLWGADLIGRIDVNYSYYYSEDECSETGSTPIEVRTDTKVYYIKDHLGSIRQTIASNGTTVLSAQDYYPFGKVLRSSTSQPLNDKYKFTGKEHDNETNFDYFGARFYDSEIGRWLSIDPLADKYPGWSPYNYCMNSPLNLIDPNGMEIRIYTGEYDDDGNEKYIVYSSGMEYNGDNKFLSSVINSLNKMNTVEIGNEVLSSLIISSNVFSFKNIQSEGGINTLQFKAFENGGGDIFAASMLNFSGNTNLENVAHELFHGYQSENGGTRGVNGEIEAYLYGRGVLATYSHMLMGFSGNNSPDGIKYANAMNALINNDSFNLVDFNIAVNTFLKGHPANNIYKNAKVFKNYTPIIEKFYPLIRW